MCRFYQELLSCGLLQPLEGRVEGLRDQDQVQNYVTPQGMSSLVRHFLSQSGTCTPAHLSVPLY